MRTTARTPSPRTRPPRTVDIDTERRQIDPRRALSGLVAAGQALVLSLAVVVLPAVVAFLVSPSGTAAGEGWGHSVTVGASLWLLGHGVPLKTGGGLITLMPQGITALALFSCYASARRSAFATRSAWVTGTVAYGVVVFAVALLAGVTTSVGLVVAAVGGTAVGAVGLGCGILARPDAPRLADLTAWASRLPEALRRGLRGGAVGVALLISSAGLLVVAWVIAGRATSQDIVTGLAPGIAGGAILAVAQTTMVPNLVMWAAAWIAGSGFEVGSGTSYTPTAVRQGVLPAVPLLGALPGASWTNTVSALAPVVVVAFGAVAGIVVLRHAPTPDRITWAEAAWSALGIVVAGFALTGCLTLLAGGEVGALEIGADAFLTAVVVAGELLIGAAIVLAWVTADVPTLVGLRRVSGDADLEADDATGRPDGDGDDATGRADGLA